MSDSDSDDSLLGEAPIVSSRSNSQVGSNKKASLKKNFEALEAQASERLDKRIRTAVEMQQQMEKPLEEQGMMTESQLKEIEATLETAGERRDRLREEEEEEEKLESAKAGRSSMVGCQTLFTPLKTKKKRIALKAKLPAHVKDALRSATKANTGPFFCAREGKSSIGGFQGDDLAFATSYLISAALTATNDIARSALTKLCVDLDMTTTVTHFETYVAKIEGVSANGQGNDNEEEEEEQEEEDSPQAAALNIANLVCFLTLFTGTQKSDLSFLAKLAGSSVIKGGVRTVFEGAWFRTTNGVEGDLGDFEGFEDLEGWSFTFAYAVIRNLPLYTATRPSRKSLQFVSGLCLFYLNGVLTRPASRISNSSDITKPYSFENNGLETAITVLKVVEINKDKGDLSSDETAAIVGLVIAFLQVCSALKGAGMVGRRKSTSSTTTTATTDGERYSWFEISTLCGNIKHGVQGTFMDEGARRLKESLGLLEGYTRWRGERGGVKEQKKMEDFVKNATIGKEKAVESN